MLHGKIKEIYRSPGGKTGEGFRAEKASETGSAPPFHGKIMIREFSDLRVAVIGGGPAGLMAAEVLGASGARVDLYDAMPSPGRKFLLAGKGGMNLTHSEDLECFLARYGDRRETLAPFLKAFDPQALRAWARCLGVETFVGSSGRVFPEGMKAAPLLRACLSRLRASGVSLHVRHRWIGMKACEDGAWSLRFMTPEGERRERVSALVLALGGGSWPKLGSDGAWVEYLRSLGIKVETLVPSNCGFELEWSAFFRERFAGEPLKNVEAFFEPAFGEVLRRRGECLVSATGLEGGLIYAFSGPLRKALLDKGEAILYLDLMPDRYGDWLAGQIASPRGSRSMASHLQSRLGLKGVKAGLVRECCDAATYANPLSLAKAIKHLPIVFRAMRPLEEAISSAGGLSFDAMDDSLMLRGFPGVFCAGEMLDWDAPTGGYLLSACFATGRAAGFSALNWLKSRSQGV